MRTRTIGERRANPLRAALAPVVLWAIVGLGLPVAGQEGPAPGSETTPETTEAPNVEALEREWLAAFDRGDYAAAEEALKRHAALEPDNFVPAYNLACARSMQGDAEGAVQWLIRAVALGFDDLAQLKRDPSMARAREHPACIALMMRWTDATAVVSKDHFEQVKRRYRRGYSYSSDEILRLHFVSAFDSQTFEQAHDEIRRIADWAKREIFRDLQDRSRDAEDPWVVVILPTPKDFQRWAARAYGGTAQGFFYGIGGHYSHDRKELVAADLGGTFRHEFLHVLHWRSNTRMGQVHPVWIQEGLCSLIEDYDLVGGRVVPSPSWRTNTVKRLARANKLPRIERLATTTREQFTGRRPLSMYAQARTFFLYLYQSGKLGQWYAHYTANFQEDPTGLASIEAVLGMTVEQINREYRLWLRTLPEVAEQRRPGRASLGVDVGPGAGDGPMIVQVVSRAARKAGLFPGDVIHSIDGHPARDLNELVRVLGDYRPGQVVQVQYRRGRRHESAAVALVPRGG